MAYQEVPSANQARLLNAISRIGYRTEIALCDLIDNSIDAGAKDIRLHLKPQQGEKAIAEAYIIYDDGKGMTKDELCHAFALGVDTGRKETSLGKFGVGLKSAGLSQSDMITVITKSAEDAQPHYAILDERHIERENKYEIYMDDGWPEEVSEEMADELNIPTDFNTGTIVWLSPLKSESAQYLSFADYLLRYCGITYSMFIKEDGINIHVGNQVNTDEIESITKKVNPIDPLFTEDVQEKDEKFPMDWDGKKPTQLLKETKWREGILVSATHLVHPPTYKDKGEDVRKANRDKYMIGEDPETKEGRHGFYIYRNRRLIVPAERFRGIVPNHTIAHAFRGRIMFDERGDNLFSLDVKKKHISLNAERESFKTLMRSHINESIDAWKAASNRLKEGKEEIEAQSLASSDSSKIDSLAENGGMETSQTAILEKIEKDTQDIYDVKTVREDIVAIRIKIPEFGNKIWMPYPDTEAGKIRVFINDAHAIVDLVRIWENPQASRLLEYFLFCLGKAELRVRSKPPKGATEKQTNHVIDEFRTHIGRAAEDIIDLLKEDTDISEGDGEEDNDEDSENIPEPDGIKLN